MNKQLPLLTFSILLSVAAFAQSGRVGIGESSPGSKGSIKGNLSVGSSYSSQPAPTDGAIIEGKTGIGKTNPDEKLDVVGNVKASDKMIGTRGFVAGSLTADTAKAVFSTDVTNKGFYIPRLTTSQKNTLGGTLGVANKGLLVYDIDLNRTDFWDGTQWKAVGDGVAGGVTADNGLNVNTGSNVRLGGTLVENTTVNQSSFNMTFGGNGLFGIGATDAGSKLNVSPGTINTGIKIGSFPASSSNKNGLAIDMNNTSSSNAIDISNIGATSMQGIRINSTANGNGTGIRLGDVTTLGTGINIRGGTGIIYNALSAASGTGIIIGGTTAPNNGIDASTAGAGTGGIFQASTAGAGVFGLSISGAYSRPALLPYTGLRGYTASNSNAASDVAYGVHGSSTRFSGSGGTGTLTYGIFGSSTGNATSAGNGLMVGSYGTASVTNVGTSGAIGGLFNAASGSTNLALAANGGGDVYLGSSDADRPSNFTSGVLNLGTGNTNTTRMFNARISGTQTFVGSTSGTVGITAPATITSYSLVLPNAQGSSGQVLKNDGSGNLSWQNDNNAGGTVTSVGLSMPSGFSVTGSPVTSSGTLTVSTSLNGPLRGNGSGFVTGNINLASEVTGTLPVANGGTGATSHPANAVLIGNGSSPLISVAPGTAGNVLVSNGTTWSSGDASGSFIRNQTSTNQTAGFRITGNGIFNGGNVGIGTTSPGERLEIGSGGNVMINIDPGNDTDQGLVSYGWRARTAGGGNNTWRMFTAPVGGGYGVIPNSVSIWQYPSSSIPGCCLERFTIQPSGSGHTGSPVRIDGNGKLQVTDLAGTGNRAVYADASGILRASSTPGVVSGSGTLNYVPKWTPDGATLGNSQLFDNGTNVGIGVTSPAEKLDVSGNIRTTGIVNANNGYQFNGVPVIFNNKDDVYGNFRVIQNNSTTLSDGMYLNYNSTGGTGAHLRFYANGTSLRGYFDAGNGNLYLNKNLVVSTDNVTGGGIYLADDGSIVDNNDGYATHRFSKGIMVTDGNNTNTRRALVTNMGNVIASAGLITGNTQMAQGPGTGADNQWHTVQLDNGYAMINLSIYATSRFDGDIRINGMYLRDLLNDGVRDWYGANGLYSGLNGTANTQTCDNCDHFANCPDNYIATGIQVYANAQLDYYGKLRCTQLKNGFSTTDNGTGVESAISCPWGNGQDDQQHFAMCPPGTFVKGFRVYASNYWDGALRLYCTGITGQ